MTAAIRLSRLYLRNRLLLLLCFIVPLLLAPFLVIATHNRRGDMFLTLLFMLTVSGALAFFLATVQREMLSRAFTFLLPGLRRGLLRQHFTAAALLGAVAFGTVLLTPAFASSGAPLVSLAWSVACLMVTAFGLTLLTVFLVPYSSWLPFNVTWLLFVVIKLWVRTPPEALAGRLDHPVLWTALALLLGALVHNRLGRPALQRRLIEEPFISLVDLKNPARIEQFKQARNQHKGRLETGSRPGAGLIGRAREKTALATARSQTARALVWGGVQALLLTSIPRRRPWSALLVLLAPVMVVYTGYWDGRMATRPADLDMVGWFPGFAFMLCFLPALAFHYLKTRPLGLLRSRRDLQRAGWFTIRLITALTMAGSGLVWLLFLVGSRVLPDITLNGCTFGFRMPDTITAWLPLFILPGQLLIYLVWRMKGSVMVLQQAGTLMFFLFHGLTQFGDQDVRLAAGALAAACWLALPFVWRWRVFKTDLA